MNEPFVDNLELEVGDVVFIRARSLLFRKVASTTRCWSNHVGLVVGHDGSDYILAESRVPLSCKTTLRKFVGRSEGGRYAVRRLPRSLDRQEKRALCRQAESRLGILYHQGFALRSRRQFCSKFVYEVYRDALGIELGSVETFADLLARDPHMSQRFWQLWFFGRIPWQRETITPTSLYRSEQLISIRDIIYGEIAA